MNLTNIDWADLTLNPVPGCLHGCPYCYGRKIARWFGEGPINERFNPRPELERLQGLKTAKLNPKIIKQRKLKGWPEKNLNDPLRIFMGSMGDLGGWWIKEEWKKVILACVQAHPQHAYLFLSKDPFNIHRTFLRYGNTSDWINKNKIYLGTTVTGAGDDVDKIIRGDETTIIASDRMVHLCRAKDGGYKVFMSFEPLLGPIPRGYILFVDWIIIGAQTGPGAVPPIAKWIEDIVNNSRKYGIPLFMKQNLAPYWPGELIREFPTGEIRS
jgi:protein gp37